MLQCKRYSDTASMQLTTIQLTVVNVCDIIALGEIVLDIILSVCCVGMRIYWRTEEDSVSTEPYGKRDGESDDEYLRRKVAEYRAKMRQAEADTDALAMQAQYWWRDDH